MFWLSSVLYRKLLDCGILCFPTRPYTRPHPYFVWVGCIAGLWHVGIRQLSPVSEHSGTGLGPYIAVPDWQTSALIFIPVIELNGCRTVRQSGIKINCTKEERNTHVHVCTAYGYEDTPCIPRCNGEGYTLHPTLQAMEMNAPCTSHYCWCRWIISLDPWVTPLAPHSVLVSLWSLRPVFRIRISKFWGVPDS